MGQSISIIDKTYMQWVKELAVRYRNSQIKASIKVNTEQLCYNWMLGRDIVEKNVEQRWGESVITQLSKDLRNELPGVQGLSKSNIYYCKKFYLLYRDAAAIFQQPVGKNVVVEVSRQYTGIFEIPWGHHCVIMDKVKGDIHKALFYVKETLENGWSRAVLLNWMDTDLYERQGKALTNFRRLLPAPESDLAQEITKDPYSFAFARITGAYNESILKEALLKNISKFLIELGTGFAYVGKDNTLAQYALESSSQPLGISEYELEKFYPEKIEGTIPTIAEIEATLNMNSHQ